LNRRLIRYFATHVLTGPTLVHIRERDMQYACLYLAIDKQHSPYLS